MFGHFLPQRFQWHEDTNGKTGEQLQRNSILWGFSGICQHIYICQSFWEFFFSEKRSAPALCECHHCMSSERLERLSQSNYIACFTHWRGTKLKSTKLFPVSVQCPLSPSRHETYTTSSKSIKQSGVIWTGPLTGAMCQTKCHLAQVTINSQNTFYSN